MRSNRSRFIATLAAIFLIIAAIMYVIGISGNEGEGTTTVNIGGKRTTFDNDNNLDKSEVKEELKDTKGQKVEPDAHEDLRDETPPGVSKQSVKRGLAQKIAPGKGEAVELGGAQGYNCRYHPVRNTSSRNGQKVLLFVLHYTVSPFGSLPGIFTQFNTPSSGTSSTFGLEVNNRCDQFMPGSGKPWTQLTFNGRSESVEIVAPGDLSRSTWLSKPIFTQGTLANLTYDRLRANGLPIRLVDPVGCGVQAAGYTDHNRLECGNVHTDVGKNFPFDVLNRQLAQLAAGHGVGGAKPPSESAIRQCKTLNRYRRSYSKLNQKQRTLAKRLRSNLESHKYICKDRGGHTFIARR